MADIEPSGAGQRVNGDHLPADDLGPVEHASQTPLDTQILRDYLSRLLVITLGATQSDLESDGSLLSEPSAADTLRRCSRFLNDNSRALYVQKQPSSVTPRDGGANGHADASTHYTYVLSEDLPISQSTVASVAILKRPQPLDLNFSLSEQLQIVNLPSLNALTNASATYAPSASPFELLHSVVHSALTPYFEAFSKSQEAASSNRANTDGDQRIGIPGAKKKLAEFELSLLQLQHNAEIPQLSLPLHPVVQSVLNEASREGSKPSLDSFPKELFDDAQFLTNLQAIVSGWIKSIQTITKTSRDPAHGSAAQEVNFWLDMESALDNIEVQLRSSGIQLSLDVLKSAKRHSATFSFGADTGLKQTLEMVQKYNQLMRDFPLPELLSATSLDKVSTAIDLIFDHLNKKFRISPYPIRRVIPLLEAISGDIDGRVHKLVNGRLLMQLPYKEFQEIIEKANTVWRTWEEHVKEFTNVLRNETRRRSERYIQIKIASRHAQTQDRLDYVARFRRNHEELQRTVSTVLHSSGKLDSRGARGGANDAAIVEELGDVDAVDEVNQAYQEMRGVDVLDISSEGTQVWDQAESLYNERTSRVENTIIARLRDRLATAKTANEMFTVFSKFNALLIRPKIRGAISEYQTQLIENVKNDIAELQERFKQQYGHSQAHAMAQLHDVPPVSGAIIWARQIERQLDGHMKKVEDVLGSNWMIHAEGQKLRTESANFRKKLDTRVIFQSWLDDTRRRDISISGQLFSITRNRALGNTLELSVNFDPHIITLFKEVRNLLCLDFQIPNSLTNVSKDAKRIYPFAVSLVETVRTFLQTSQTITGMPEVSLLLDGYRLEVQSLVEKGVPLKWESFAHVFQTPLGEGAVGSSRVDSKHVQLVRDLAAAVSKLESKTATLASIHESIQQHIAQVKTCSYDFSAVKHELDSIQSLVDRLSLESFANLDRWVANTNQSIRGILLERLEGALSAWARAFEGPAAVDDTPRPTSSQTEPGTNKPDSVPRFEPLVHEVSMRNQIISLEPPLEFARSSLLAQLQDWMSRVCDQRRIQASRFNLTVQDTDSSAASFADLLSQCESSLSGIYAVIDDRLNEARDYVDKWLQFQSLWDLQSDHVYETLGDDLGQWLQLLQEIRKARSTFETSHSKRQIGLLSIDYEQVRNRINAKYDSWQNEILQRFSGKLRDRMTEVWGEMSQIRKELESSTLSSSSTTQAVAFITAVQNATRKVHAWESEVENFRQGQAALLRQRFAIPPDWVSVEQIDHEWDALNEILRRKSKLVEDQTDALRAQITAEDKAVAQKVADIKSQWSEEKPSRGSIPPDEAARILDSFESKLTKLSNESDMVNKAKEALDLPPNPDIGLGAILEEVSDFKSIWANLSTVWKGLNELRETLWTSVQPRKLRQSLDALLTSSKEMPSRMRQYDAYEYFQATVKKLLKVNPILSDLRSEAMRERHWVQIFKQLKPSKRYSQLALTLGDVWDLQLAESEKIIRGCDYPRPG